MDDPQRLDVMAAVGAPRGHLPTLDAKDWLGVQMLAYQIDGWHEQAAGPEAFMTVTRRAPFQAGVLPLAHRKTELLFVTLDKSEGYHDRISYDDFAISAERFHWQTQNSAGPDTPSGRHYLESATNGGQFQLFVRPRKGDAYRACGRVALESAEGDRPMSRVWKLETPLPVRLFREFSVLRRM
ncbi:MAG: DUF3427 domain-containing protein [Rubrivivax sp.]|nr:DUF3427 domain-containing protein [Rubrivivax sp.]